MTRSRFKSRESGAGENESDVGERLYERNEQKNIRGLCYMSVRNDWDEESKNKDGEGTTRIGRGMSKRRDKEETG